MIRRFTKFSGLIKPNPSSSSLLRFSKSTFFENSQSSINPFDTLTLQRGILTQKISRNFAKKKKGGKTKQTGKKQQGEEEGVSTEERISVIDFTDYENQLSSVLEAAIEEISEIKFGHIQPEQFEEIVVKAYGEETYLQDLAQMVPKSEKQILINVYDTTLVSAVKSALDLSNMDLDIVIDRNQNILATVNNLNVEEAKKAYSSLIANKKDYYREKMKKVRVKEMDKLGKMKDGLSKDVIFQSEKEVQTMFKATEEQLLGLVKSKLE